MFEYNRLHPASFPNLCWVRMVNETHWIIIHHGVFKRSRLIDSQHHLLRPGKRQWSPPKKSTFLRTYHATTVPSAPHKEKRKNEKMKKHKTRPPIQPVAIFIFNWCPWRSFSINLFPRQAFPTARLSNAIHARISQEQLVQNIPVDTAWKIQWLRRLVRELRSTYIHL